MRLKKCQTKLSGPFCIRKRQTRRETGAQSHGSASEIIADRQTAEFISAVFCSLQKEVQTKQIIFLPIFNIT
jgi:hypothetical protein